MKILKSELKFDGYLKVHNLEIMTSNGGIINREVVSKESDKLSDDAVMCLLYDKKKESIILVKQFRQGLFRQEDKFSIEAVAGTLEKGECPEECVKREVLEEVGYEIDEIFDLGSAFSSPGCISEKTYLYIATVGDRINNGGGLEEENEEIEVIEVPLDDLDNFNIMDVKTRLLLSEFKEVRYFFI